MPDRVWEDCCDFCRRVDGSDVEEPCPRMRQRCKGDTCSTCKPCLAFFASSAFRPADQLVRTRPKALAPKAPARGQGRRLMVTSIDRPDAWKVRP